MTATVNDIIQQAQQQTGLTDIGDEWFLGPLGAWVEDLAHPRLSPWGQAFMARLAVKDVARRLRVIDCLKHYPQISATPIPPIVYITGHERSGTTLLHNLLALHQGAKSLVRWELMQPTPPPEAATFATDPRRAEVQKSVDALRGSDLETMHWVDAHEPEECAWGLMDCTGLLGMAPGRIMPTWQQWMASHDMRPTFENYRKLMQLLLWRNPPPEGGFLVLKSPQITAYLPAFADVFAEANFVFIHRDPHRVLSSFCNLIDIVDGPFLQNRADIEQQERQQQSNLKRMRHYYQQMQQFAAAQPGRVHNVQYMRLLAQPETEVQALYQAMGVAVDPALADKIGSFLTAQKAGKRAQPRQQLNDFGYSREQVIGDAVVADYLREFAVELEPSRRTGV